jgi:cytochrome c-type biogenesis protein CcmH/NrfF
VESSGIVKRSNEERAVTRKLACWCGCPHLPVGDCTCGHCAMVAQEVEGMLAKGQTEQQILAHYVAQAGGNHVLAEPPNSGIGILTWMLPYTVGALGIVYVGITAARWNRRRSASPFASTTDPDIEARLNDELRDLD